MKLSKILLWLLIFVLLSASCTKLENETSQNELSEPKTFNWQMVTVWPEKFDILTQGIKQFIEDIRIISNERLNITLVDDNRKQSVFDRVSSGEIEMGHSVAYLWTDKIPAAQFMASVPFGMDAMQHFAWLNNGDGLQLWRELYHPHDLIPFPMGNTGMQMGGWFNKQIKKTADFKELKIRLPGIAGEVLVQNLKMRPILKQPDNLINALKDGSLDAVEWMGPYYDKELGLHLSQAKNYYFPGWHEPGTTLELIINRQAWETLPDVLKKVVEIVANNTHQWIYTQFESKNAQALQELKSDNRIYIMPFEDNMLAELRETTKKLLEQKAEADRDFDNVYKNYREFQQKMDSWRTKAQQLYSE